MLILTRRPGERLIIGEAISVLITEVKGKDVRIGIEAPKDISIFRDELYSNIISEVEGKCRED